MTQIEIVMREASLNPFAFMNVYIATHMVSSTEITGAAMKLEQSKKKLSV